MAGTDTTSFDAMLKEFYVDKVVEEVNQNTILNDYFDRRDDMPSDGRRVVYPAHVSRNSGVGAVGEGGTLPTAGSQGHVDFQIPYRYNYGRIEITAQTIKQSQTSKGAFRKAVDDEIKRTARDVRRDRNRQMFGYGLGILALCNGAVSGTTTIVDSSYGITAPINGNRFFKVGDSIAYINPGDGTVRDADTVATVNANGLSFTTTNSVTASDNDYIVRAANGAITAVLNCAYNKEVMGLLGMLDDGTLVATYHGILRSTYPVMNTFVSNLQADLSLNALQKCFDAADQRGNGDVKVMFSHHSVRREYTLLLQSMRRYIDEMAKSPDGGFKGKAIKSDITYAEVPLKVDRDAPYRVILGLDPTFCYRYVATEGEWADDDGRILLRVADKDSYEARYRVFDNFCNDAPNTGFLMKGITLQEDEEVIQHV